MRKQDGRFEDDSVFDERGVLREGATARISMTMRDSVDDGPLDPGELARRMQLLDSERRRSGRPFVVDATGDSLLGLRKPGFRFLAGGTAQDERQREQLRDARHQAYLDYSRDQQNSWRSPPASNTGSLEHSGGKVGGVCMVDGRPGHLVEGDDGALYCEPDDELDRNQLDGMSLGELKQHHRRVLDASYKQYEADLTSAWKSK